MPGMTRVLVPLSVHGPNVVGLVITCGRHLAALMRGTTILASSRIVGDTTAPCVPAEHYGTACGTYDHPSLGG